MNVFTPHGFCLAWDPAVLWLTIAGDAGIAFAYFGIPFMLLLSLRWRQHAVPWWLTLIFALFILACGLSHVAAIVTLWYPWYWVEAIEKAVTAAISLVALYMLPVAMMHIRELQKR